MNQGGTILAIAQSSRTLGFALADRLGLIDADIVSLKECQIHSGRQRLAIRWLDFALKHLQPDIVVLEELSARRQTRQTTALCKAMEQTIKTHSRIRLMRTTRKTALQKHRKIVQQQQNRKQTQQDCIRRLAIKYAPDCKLLFFHRPLQAPRRTDWDRSWGQAVVASALAEHTRQTQNTFNY